MEGRKEPISHRWSSFFWFIPYEWNKREIAVSGGGEEVSQVRIELADAFGKDRPQLAFYRVIFSNLAFSWSCSCTWKKVMQVKLWGWIPLYGISTCRYSVDRPHLTWCWFSLIKAQASRRLGRWVPSRRRNLSRRIPWFKMWFPVRTLSCWRKRTDGMPVEKCGQKPNPLTSYCSFFFFLAEFNTKIKALRVGNGARVSELLYRTEL